MLLNSFLNFLLCFINIFHLINSCTSYSGIFCSTFKRHISVQYYEIYVIEFFGSILKTLSNISALVISMERYALQNRGFIFNRIKRLSIYWRMGIFVIFIGFILFAGLDKILSSRLGHFFYDMDYYDYTETPEKNIFLVYNIDGYEKPTSVKMFYLYFLFYFLVNDILIVSILFLFDIFMLAKFKSQLSSKRVRLVGQNRFSSNNLVLRKINKLEFRITAVILLSGIALFLIRFLEFSLSFFVFIQKTNGNVCNSLNKICTNYLQFGNALFLISCCYPIIVFYNLNKPFRTTLSSFFRKRKQDFEMRILNSNL